MSARFILSCESTIDLPYAYAQERDIPILFYAYSVDNQEYPDDMGRNPDALPRFYAQLQQGHLPTTTQLNQAAYLEFLEPLLMQGDVLHLVFGSGMTSSIQNARTAANVLRKKYPQRKLFIVDSFCSSSGYGLMADGAADLRDQGATLEETARWAESVAHSIHHQFFSTDLQYFRRSGRMSGPAAAIGAILDICPLMRLNYDGKIIAYGKVQGKKRALRETVKAMEAHAVGGADYCGKCFICHSNCLNEAQTLKAALQEKIPHIQGDIRICDIGTIIASHCGPGTVAVFFFGDTRPV